VPNLGDRYVWQFATKPQSNEFLGKIDHNFNERHRLNGSFFGTKGSLYSRGGTFVDYLNRNTASQQQTLAVRHTWTMSASRILEVQFAQARHNANLAVAEQYVGKTLADYGANLPQAIPNGLKLLPGVQISDGPSTDQPGSSGGDFLQDNIRTGATMAIVKGGHNFKFGFEAQRSSVGNTDLHDNLLYRFQGRLSNRGQAVTNYVPNALFAHSMADFLMGRYNDTSVGGALDYSMPAWSYYAFAQDSWRISRKLTLNYGLRYEFYFPYREVSGKQSAFVAEHQSNLYPNAPRHIAFAGDRNVPDGFIPLSKTNFAPRVGLAYDVFGDGKLAVRAGYGTYFAFPGAQINVFSASEFPQRPNIQGQEGLLKDPWLTSKVPVFTAMPVPFPTDQKEYLSTYKFVAPFARIIGFDPVFKTPRSYQWNFQVEREFRSGISVTAAYVGSRQRALLQAIPFNYARFQPTPAGQPPSLDINNIIARTQYPEHSRFSLRIDSSGNAIYDALQLSATVRFQGLTLRPWYEYAGALGDGGGTSGSIDEDPSFFTSQSNNPANPRGEWGRRARLHTFRAFWVYDLPFFTTTKGVTKTLLGGWQFSGNVGIFSGSPLDVILGYDANFDGITSAPQDRPDLLSPIQYTTGSQAERMQRYMNPASFGRPVISATNLAGNLQRNAVWGPGNWNANAAMLKNFRFAERYTMQVRMEAYNFFNHPNLTNPNTSMSSADFTKILQLSGNRTMQFGLRFSF
nr:hypothetical protein [Bryobacter sp.]